MQNDTLKNRIAPWQEKGRWYHARVTESGMDINNSDDFMIQYFNVNLNSNYVKLTSPNHIIIDFLIRYNDFEVTADTFGPLGYRHYPDGCMGIQWLKPATFTKLDEDVYLYVVEKNV